MRTKDLLKRIQLLEIHVQFLYGENGLRMLETHVLNEKLNRLLKKKKK